MLPPILVASIAKYLSGYVVVALPVPWNTRLLSKSHTMLAGQWLSCGF